MNVQPLYRGEQLNPAYCLRYSWTGWPSSGRFEDLPDAELLTTVGPLWETDRLRLMEHHWSANQIQLTFSARPDVTPVFVARRAKGRLQDALRKAGCGQHFSRKLAVRSVGKNSTQDVQRYIESQVGREQFADPDFAKKMEAFTVTNPKVNLSVATESARGRYWYNLHLVLIVESRLRIVNLSQLARIRDGCFRIGDKKGYGIASVSVMLEHLHVAMRGDHRQSPQEIALAFQNNLAFLLGQQRIWAESFYVGTFSEYNMNAVRTKSPSVPCSL